MSSIQGAPQSDHNNSINRASGAEVDYSDDAVDRGYSQKNSYSRTEGQEKVQSQVPKPALDTPDPEADSDATTQKVIQDFKASGEESPLNGLKQALNKRLDNPFGLEKQSLEEGRASLLKQGFSEEQVNSLIKLIETKGGGGKEGFPAIFSHSAKIDEIIDGGEGLDKLFNTYRDVITRYPAITSIPPELKAEIDAKMNAFTKAALSSDPVLDVDSATTMLMEIQTKLQGQPD